MSTTANCVLEHVSHTVPISIRLQECLLQEFCRIYNKPIDAPLHKLVVTLYTDKVFMDHKIITPLHHLKMYSKYLTNPDILHQTPTPTLCNDMEIKLPTVVVDNRNFGSSSSRSAEQAQAAKLYAQNIINQAPEKTVIIFTDGSALNNPGPCGAATIIYVEGIRSQPIVSANPISSLSSSYHGELEALKMAAQSIFEMLTSHNSFDNVYILSDCISAIQSVSSLTDHDSHQDTINAFQRYTNNIIERGIKVYLYWVAGHVDLPGNELADKHAKIAAEQAMNMTDDSCTSVATVKGVIKRCMRNRWQRYWETIDTGREYYHHFPNVPTKRYKSCYTRAEEVRYLRLITGNNRLNDHMYKLRFVESPMCVCESEPETSEHVLLRCKLYDEPRQSMIDSIELHYVRQNTPYYERTLSFGTLIAPSHSSLATRSAIKQAVIAFMAKTKLKL